MYDYCIVGTGPSSWALISKILSSNIKKKILVIEAGSNAELKKKQIKKKFKLHPTHHIGLGGTSELWHNIIAPLDPEDFNKKDSVEYSGWPISYYELYENYTNVCKELGFDFSSIFDCKNSYLENQEVDKNYSQMPFDLKPFLHLKKPLRTKKHFEYWVKSGRIDLVEDVIATNFVIKHAFDVECLRGISTQDAKPKYFKAKNYILCAGALNSPLILMNTDGFSERLPALGRFLMDHPMGNLSQYKLPRKSKSRLFSGVDSDDKFILRYGLRIIDSFVNSYNILNSLVYLRPSFSEGLFEKTEKLTLSLIAVRSKLINKRLPINEIFHLLKNWNLIRQVILFKTGYFPGHKLVDAMYITEQVPNINNRIELNVKGSDDLSSNIYWELSQKDIDSVSKFRLFIDQLMDDIGAVKTCERKKINESLHSAAHHLGTVRMGDCEEISCVDSNLKLHCSSNIYIADGSVFATSGNANPTLTVMALADRLGGYLNAK